MRDLQGTQTKENLQKALTGEALAHLKYQFYQKKLSEFNKSYDNILSEIIHNEKEHGEIWFKLLHDGEIPANETNLLDAIAGETKEATELYINYGKTAHEEGLIEISKLFYEIASIEAHHSEIFTKIKEEITAKNYYTTQTTWKCLNCGYELKDTTAPSECPVCKHPQKYFKNER